MLQRMFSLGDSMGSALSDLPQKQGGDIVLIGMMGCGKTTVGRALSIDLERPMLDMDTLIEEQIGKTIPEIFKEEGEAHFRSLETALLRYLVVDSPRKAEGCILSTGGGVPLRDENRELMRRLGFVVWLRVDAEVLYERTSRSNHRPLLSQPGCARTRLVTLCEQRYPIYEQTAHYILDTSQMDIHDVLLDIKEAAQRYFASTDS